MWGIVQRFRRHQLRSARVKSHLEFGELGEKLAAQYLQQHDYRIVVTNFVAPIGYSRTGRQITGEIDIVAYDESTRPFMLCFIEVKTRASGEIALPEAAIDLRKQRQIARTARIFRLVMAVDDEPYRYDVVSIVLSPQKEVEVNLLRDFFTERRFKRRSWYSQKI